MKRKHPAKKHPGVKIEEGPLEDYDDEEEPTPNRTYASTQDADVRTIVYQYSPRSSSSLSKTVRIRRLT